MGRKKGPVKVRMGLYVSAEVRDLAHRLQVETGRSISHMFEEAIREWGRGVERERTSGVSVKIHPEFSDELWKKIEERIEEKVEYTWKTFSFGVPCAPARSDQVELRKVGPEELIDQDCPVVELGPEAWKRMRELLVKNE